MGCRSGYTLDQTVPGGGAYEFERGFGVPINSSIGCGEETETEVAPKSE